PRTCQSSDHTADTGVPRGQSGHNLGRVSVTARIRLGWTRWSLAALREARVGAEPQCEGKTAAGLMVDAGLVDSNQVALGGRGEHDQVQVADLIIREAASVRGIGYQV